MSVPSAPNIYIRPRALIDSVFLYWRPPLDIGASPILSYNVTCSEASYDQTFPATERRITVSSLSSGVDYTFQITATNSQGTGPAATYRTVQVGLAPAGAQNVDAVVETSTSVAVTWSFSTNTGEAPTRWFVLSAIPTIPSVPMIRKSAHGYERTRELFNLSTNISYRILVQAVCDAGYAPPTALSQIITMGPGAPSSNFLPSMIPGLLFWGDMSQLTGSPVTSVPNRATINNPNVTLIGNGSVSQNALNGLNVLSVDTNQSFTGTNLSLPDWTMFTVARKNSQDGRFFTDGGNYIYGYWGNARATFNLQAEGVHIYPQDAIPNNEPSWDIQTLTKWNDANGLNVQFNWNGTTLLQGTSATYTNKDTLLTNFSINTYTGQTGNGDVAEILIFEYSLSQEEIQAVEGYLANKWGLQSKLPESHPYKVNPPQTLAPLYWNPTLLSGCQVWLDAADPTSLLTTDSTVNTWLDKSGNTNNATAYNSPQIQNQAVVFNGSNTYFTTPYTAAPQIETIFIVLNSPNYSGQQDIISGAQNGNRELYLDNYTLKLGPYGGGTTLVSNTSLINDNTYLLEVTYNSTEATSYKDANKDGSLTGNFTYSGGGTTQIGGAFTYFNGSISEIVIYNRQLSQEERQITEGYLAWKWGLQGQIPLSHPFAYNAPKRTQPLTFNPLAINGCQLWLDGNDQTTIVKTGSTVTQWKDKSGLNNSTTGVIGTPTFTPGTGIIFDGSSYFTLPNGCIPYGNTAYSIYVITTFPDDQGSYGILGAGTANSSSCISIRSGNTGSFGVIFTYWYGDDISTGSSFTVGVPTLYNSLYQVGGERKVFLSGDLKNTDTPTSTRIQPDGPNVLGSTVVSENMTGVISEFLVYNTNHTTEERQTVEGYLAWKWSIQDQLPTTHPYYTKAPTVNQQTTWSPKNITSLGFWLDGADISGNLANDVPVTTWLDKSQNQCNALCPTNAPITAVAGGVTFDGTQQMSFDINPQITATTTCFFVTSPSAGSGSGSESYLYSSGNNSSIIFNYGEQIKQFNCASADGIFVATGANPVSIYSYTRVANVSNIGYYMSAEVFNNNPVTTPAQTGLSYLGSAGNVGYFNGTIYEIIFYNKALTTSERQVVEGYLAWKWSIQDQLPNNHPFYNAPPSPNEPTSWQPTKLNGLNLWLDASDPNSTLTDNTNLLTILDKSGNQNNMTSKTGVVGIDTTTFSGQQALSLNNTYFLGPINPPLTTTQFTSFAVGTLNASSAIWGLLLSLGANETTSFDSPNYAYAFARNNGSLGFTTDRNSNFVSTSIPAYDSPFLLYSSQQVNNAYIGVNGQLNPNVGATGISSAFDITEYSIGTENLTSDANGYYTGKVGEIILTNTTLTKTHRQIVEGYLAWKWGLQSTLPTLHPYYTHEPSPYLVVPVTQLHLSSNTDDSGINPQTVTQTGNVTFTKIGTNTCAYFPNSTDTYLSVPFTPTQNFTIAYWFNVLDTGYYNPWSLSDSATVSGSYRINPDLFDGTQRFWMGFTGGTIDAGGWTYPTASGVWYHVALTVNQVTGVCSSYLNGVHKTTVQASGTLPSSNYIILGKDATSSRAYNGYMSQFCIYDQALTNNEIQWIYQNVTPLPPPNLLLLLLRASSYSGTGDWLDESNQGNNASLEQGTINKNADGNGIILDGSTSWILPNVAADNRWTLNVWFKPTVPFTSADSACIVCQTLTNNNINIALGNSSNNFNGGFYSNGTWINGTPITLTTNEWTNIQVTWDGSQLNTYIDSVLLGSVSGAETSNDSTSPYIIGHGGWGYAYVTGEIGEIRIYNYALSQLQVQNDYQSSFNTFFYNPTQISGLQLWLDAADISSLTLNGQNVTEWADKSGNAHNATVVSTPTYNSNAITIIPGTSIKAPVLAQTFINAFQAFVVYKSLGAPNTTTEAVITRGNSTVSSNLGNPLDMQGSEFFIGRNNEVFFRNSYNCYNTNLSIFNLNINQETQESESFSVFSNGTQASGQYLSRGPPSVWTKSDDGDTVTIGGRVDNASSINAKYNEVLIFNKVLSTNERQTVEGYLAWKWSLQSQLPSDHPYKNSAP